MLDEGGAVQELIVLEYEGGGSVSLDVNHLHKLSFYASKRTEGVVLDSLNKKGAWESKRRNAKKQAKEIVGSLLSAYAKRTKSFRPSFAEDSSLEGLFIGQFPYEETLDQKRAWEEISKDMSKESPKTWLLKFAMKIDMINWICMEIQQYCFVEDSLECKER